MIRSLLWLPALLALALPPTPTPVARAPIGPGAILAMHRDLFAAIDRGDGAAAAAFLGSDRKGPGGSTSLFLLDRAGAPTRATGATDARELLAKVAAESKSAGGTFQTRITTEIAECPASELAFAVLELERVHAHDGREEVRRYRSTSLVRYEESGWKLLHWHLSAAAGTE
jgi:hypothetical protein